MSIDTTPEDSAGLILSDGTLVEPFQTAVDRILSKGPETINGRPNRDVIPAPYLSAEQYVQSRFNLIEDADEKIRQMKSEVERLTHSAQELRAKLPEAKRQHKEVMDNLTPVQNHRIGLSNIRKHTAGYLKKTADDFMVLQSSRLQSADADYLKRVSAKLREMADHLDSAAGGDS
jgi:TolA-binding protein